MFPPGIEPGTFCVLGRRDNRYTTETSSTLCLYYGLSCSLPQEELKSWRSSEGVVNKDKRCKVVKFKSHLLNSSISYIASISSRDRLVVRTLRCGRSNPGSNPGHGIFFLQDRLIHWTLVDHFVCPTSLSQGRNTSTHSCHVYRVRMAERSKALRSGRSPLLWAWVRIPLLTLHHFFFASQQTI